MKYLLGKKALMLVAFMLTVAGGSANASELAVTSTVARLIAMGTGTFYLTLNDDFPSCTNTSIPRRYVATVGQAGMTTDGLKLTYATAMYAAGLNKQVMIYFDDTTSSCFITRVLVLN